MLELTEKFKKDFEIFEEEQLKKDKKDLINYSNEICLARNLYLFISVTCGVEYYQNENKMLDFLYKTSKKNDKNFYDYMIDEMYECDNSFDFTNYDSLYNFILDSYNNIGV